MKIIFKTILFAIAGFFGIVLAWKLIDNAANYTAWVVMLALVAVVYLVVKIGASSND